MHEPIISMIAAMDENRGIGRANQLLWDIPEDLQRFREKTKNHAVIMGRKTYQSIGHPLPHRPNIVISRNPDFRASGVQIAATLEDALEIAKQTEEKEIFVIGGANVYAQALPLADRLYLTLVHHAYEADAFFPDYKSLFRRETEREEHPDHNPAFTYLTLEK